MLSQQYLSRVTSRKCMCFFCNDLFSQDEHFVSFFRFCPVCGGFLSDPNFQEVYQQRKKLSSQFRIQLAPCHCVYYPGLVSKTNGSPLKILSLCVKEIVLSVGGCSNEESKCSLRTYREKHFLNIFKNSGVNWKIFFNRVARKDSMSRTDPKRRQPSAIST